ncbi:MAG TPA: hypothetical protein VMS22_10635 [Candidatus Eisenbacteria bacterium]|nr:hypothetical protein [Candidatus Eisenbacteria bacterium]
MISAALRASRPCLTAVAGVLVLGGVAGAFHDEPKRAKTLKAPLVTAYQQCTAPNTTTMGVPALPACYPAVRSDPLCGFVNGSLLAGYGKASGRARPNGDFKIDITLRGINSGCEGQTLCGLILVRATTHRCAQGPCTTADLPFQGSSPTACCIVVDGACNVSTTINSEVLGTLVVGDRTGIEVFGFGIRRTSGPNPPTGYTFSSGGLTP